MPLMERPRRWPRLSTNPAGARRSGSARHRLELACWPGRCKGANPRPVLGVVLLTDGRQNAPGDPGRGADRLAARGIPIYPVLIGSTIAPKDVAIASVKAPENVLKGDIASIEVAVKADGVAGRRRPGDPRAAWRHRHSSKWCADRPTDRARSSPFACRWKTLGPQDLAVSVGPLVGDARPDNDRRAVTIQVADDKARVLLVDGEARWEFRYLYQRAEARPACRRRGRHLPAAQV